MTFEEKIPLGETVTLGTHTFEPEEIKAFARRYDPQPFHVSGEKARNSLFGALCASGWHTAAMWMRHNVLANAARQEQIHASGDTPVEFGPASGIRDLQWLKPTYAGDTITFTQTALSHRPIPDRPGWHMLKSRCEAINQKGETVMRFKASVMAKEG